MTQHVLARAPGVGVADMVNPALHADVKLGEGDLPGAVVDRVCAKSTGNLELSRG